MNKTYENVSVVICAYTEKRLDDLLAAVASVQQQTVPPQEIIIVIDHDPTLFKCVEERLVGVAVIENSFTKGLSGARNSGIAIARATIIAFLDDDAVAETNWIEQLLIPYDNPQVVGVGGKINPLWIGEHPSWFPEEFNWVVGCTYRGMPCTMTSIRNMIGANMSLRRDTLIDVGGFREAFGCNHENTSGSANPASVKWLQHSAGDEETELCIRTTHQYKNNVHFYYVPAALVWHRVPNQRIRLSYFLWRCYDEGLGKAFLAALHDKQVSLSSERAYTLKTLPLGILHGLTDTFFQCDLTGLARAGAILTGLLVTTFGYIVGRVSSKAINTYNHVGIKLVKETVDAFQ